MSTQGLSALPALLSPLSIAPMIDWTYTHFRVFMRILAPKALLYTEMISTGAVEHNAKRALAFSSVEQPLALQLGGADKDALQDAAKKAEKSGFQEVNLNLGCPSDKVQAGRFGACLMAEAQLVADCIRAMKNTIAVPITAKTRIGIDHQDSYAFFAEFAHTLAEAGCDKLIIHARKAWLKGLSPKQNRSIPPLHYEYAYRIKQELPNIPVVLNGNITQVDEVSEHMQFVDGVMIGRLACDNPYALTEVHRYLFPNCPIKGRGEIVSEYLEYARQAFAEGASLQLLIKPLFNFAHGLSGSKFWKKQLTEAIQQKKLSILETAALDMVF